MDPRIVLTVAGSDSSGGAGVQADLKTLQDLGVYGTSVVTAVTAQTFSTVRAIHLLPAEVVRAQSLRAAFDLPVHAVKVGMVGSAEVARAVLEALDGAGIPLVVDPVMVASSGARLLDEAAVEALRALMAIATVVTPNHAEAGTSPTPWRPGHGRARRRGRLRIACGAPARRTCTSTTRGLWGGAARHRVHRSRRAIAAHLALARTSTRRAAPASPTCQPCWPSPAGAGGGAHCCTAASNADAGSAWRSTVPRGWHVARAGWATNGRGAPRSRRR